MDKKIFKLINKHSGDHSFIDSFMIWISNNIRYVFFFIFLVLWFRNQSEKQVTIRAIVSGALTLIINMLCKQFFFKPRPFMKGRVGILIPSKKDSTFPSKHTILVFAISTSIFLYKKMLGFMMLTLAILTGFSRIWVGSHYPSDIIGSAFIGSLTSWGVNHIKPFKLNEI